MGIGEGDSLDVQSQEEGQPAAPRDADALEGTGHPDPIDSREAPRKRRKRRKARRAARPRSVAPAEPGEREAAAAAALAELEPPAAVEPEIPAGQSEPAEGDEAGELGAADLAQLAEESAPVFRVAFKGAALALRGRFPRAAASFYEGADLRARALAGTLGLRLAARLGLKLSILAMVAEVAEPFLADRWEARP